jgi:hypothetical protein
MAASGSRDKRFQNFTSSRSAGSGDSERLVRARLREDERWGRARALGVLGTVLIHFLLLILFRQVAVPTYSETSAAGPPMGDIRPAGGGSGLTMIEVRPEQTPPVEEVVQPVPVPAEVVVVPVETPPAAPAPDPAPAVTPSAPGTTAPGTGGTSGPATGPGIAEGAGQGGGGESDGGVAQIIPPTPRGIFLPPPGRPASARNQEITVWVYVTEAGRVDRGTVRLEPPTSDSRYNQRLIQSVAEWVFDPARQAGRAVPVWYPFQIIL